MHELSLAAAILEIVEGHADGRRVRAVQLKVGHLRQVVPTALTFGFEVLAQGTAAEGAVLEIESVPAEGICRGCGARSRLESFPLHCSACGGISLEIVAGEEFTVESLDLEAPDSEDPDEESLGQASSELEKPDHAGP